jgi:hypothetical protein
LKNEGHFIVIIIFVIEPQVQTGSVTKTLYALHIQTYLVHIVPERKGQGQPACQKEWKKCEEKNEW